MNIAFAIPYRRQGSDRQANLGAIIDWIAQHYPGAAISTTDSHHARFNLAAARNAAVSHFHEADVIVICDADVILDPAATSEAARSAMSASGVARGTPRAYGTMQ